MSNVEQDEDLVNFNPEFRIIDGVPMTSSLEVARIFEKRHDNVLQSIKVLIREDEEDHALTFQDMVMDVKIGSGAVRSTPYFLMPKDTFVFLVQGFTGRRAKTFKLAYIRAFNAMHEELREQQLRQAVRAARGDGEARAAGKQQRLAFTDALRDLVEYAKTQGSTNAERYYSIFTLMEYKELGIDFAPSTQPFRDTLSVEQLGLLGTAEIIAARTVRRGIEAGLNYKDIFITTRETVRQMMSPTVAVIKK